MSIQRFTGAFREVLWVAHHERCFYCKRPLAFMVMEIDHLLPEALLKNKQELKAIITRLGQPDDFNILGFENLVPSCEPCNKEKSSLLLADGAVSIQLAKVKNCIPKIEALLEKRAQERSLDNTLRHIVRSLEAGKFTQEELTYELEILRRFPDGFRGSSPDAPPVSPDTAKFNMFISEESRILWSETALMQIQKLDLDAGKINEYLYRAVEIEPFKIRRLKRSPNVYILHVEQKGLRLIFEPTERGTCVHDVLAKKR